MYYMLYLSSLQILYYYTNTNTITLLVIYFDFAVLLYDVANNVINSSLQLQDQIYYDFTNPV